MKPLVPVELKASEYPQKYHWNTMTLKDIIHTQMSDNADFLLARPEYKKAIPGIMSNTIQAATMIKAWSPDWYHWFRFSVARRLHCQFPNSSNCKWQHLAPVRRLTGVTTGLLVSPIELGRSPYPGI